MANKKKKHRGKRKKGRKKLMDFLMVMQVCMIYGF